jgi:hypothetical protein
MTDAQELFHKPTEEVFEQLREDSRFIEYTEPEILKAFSANTRERENKMDSAAVNTMEFTLGEVTDYHYDTVIYEYTQQFEKKDLLQIIDQRTGKQRGYLVTDEGEKIIMKLFNIAHKYEELETSYTDYPRDILDIQTSFDNNQQLQTF